MTLIVTHLLKSTGKIIINLQGDVEINLLKRDSMGGREKVQEFGNAEFAECYLHLEFYNSSEIPKSIRDIYIYILDNDKVEITKVVPKDTGTSRLTAGMYFTDDLKILNLIPKRITQIKLNYFVGKEVNRLERQKYIYFEYKTVRGKMKRKLIKKF